MDKAKKIIGTLTPLDSLHSIQFPQYGRFENGELFLDWLKKSGQSAWQLLPLHETQLELGSKEKHVASPYKGYGIGLNPKYLSDLSKDNIPTDTQLQVFQEENADWLNDYSLFCAIRDRFETDDWTKWDEPIRKRDGVEWEKIKQELNPQINTYIVEQWQLHKSYTALREKAKQYGIFLVGDIPYYLGIKSPLVWANQSLFDIADDYRMHRVSGIPSGEKEYFGRQLWGHPLYHWGSEFQNQHVIDLWKIRLRYLAQLFDSVRFDHAHGFFLYGSLDPENSAGDTWESGPGFSVFKEIISYAKDFGLHTYAEGTSKIREHSPKEELSKLDVWMIRILSYGINEKTNEVIEKNALVDSYPPHTVACTSIHDTEPLVGYLQILTPSQKKILAELNSIPFNADDKKLAVLFRQKVINSTAKIVIIPLQDWLLTKDRINTPGTEREKNDPNWHFRLNIPVEKLVIATE